MQCGETVLLSKIWGMYNVKQHGYQYKTFYHRPYSLRENCVIPLINRYLYIPLNL